MSFTESIKICLQKYVDFNGRASRSEYWWFVLLTVAVRFIPIIGWLIWLALILPSLSVQARRLHDMERSAWWLLLLLPPIFIIGAPILLIMSIFPGTPGYNRYGPDPMASQVGPGGFDYVDPGGQYVEPVPPYDSTPDYGQSTYGDDPAASQSAHDYPAPDTEQQRQFCTQCGIQLQPEARYCSVCGTSV